jgi:hypothetical protein
VLRAWINKNTTIRTRKQEERCIAVRLAKRAAGLRLFVHGNKTVPTLMGTLPSKNGSEMGNATAQVLEEVCMVHFQGLKSE